MLPASVWRPCEGSHTPLRGSTQQSGSATAAAAADIACAAMQPMDTAARPMRLPESLLGDVHMCPLSCWHGMFKKL